MFKKFKDFFDFDIGLIVAILVFCVLFGIIAEGMSSDSSMKNASNYKNGNSFGYRMNLRGKMGWGIGKNGINYYNFGKTH